MERPRYKQKTTSTLDTSDISYVDNDISGIICLTSSEEEIFPVPTTTTTPTNNNNTDNKKETTKTIQNIHNSDDDDDDDGDDGDDESTNEILFTPSKMVETVLQNNDEDTQKELLFPEVDENINDDESLIELELSPIEEKQQSEELEKQQKQVLSNVEQFTENENDETMVELQLSPIEENQQKELISSIMNQMDIKEPFSSPNSPNKDKLPLDELESDISIDEEHSLLNQATIETVQSEDISSSNDQSTKAAQYENMEMMNDKSPVKNKSLSAAVEAAQFVSKDEETYSEEQLTDPNQIYFSNDNDNVQLSPNDAILDKGTKIIFLKNWYPSIHRKRLIFYGNSINLNNKFLGRICKQQLSPLIFIDNSGRTCGLEGPMNATEDIPKFIIDKFKYIYRVNDEIGMKDGIPQDWKKLVILWDAYMKCKQKDEFNWEYYLNAFPKLSYDLLNLNDEGNMYSLIFGKFAKTEVHPSLSSAEIMIQNKYHKYKMLRFIGWPVNANKKSIFQIKNRTIQHKKPFRLKIKSASNDDDFKNISNNPTDTTDKNNLETNVSDTSCESVPSNHLQLDLNNTNKLQQVTDTNDNLCKNVSNTPDIIKVFNKKETITCITFHKSTDEAKNTEDKDKVNVKEKGMLSSDQEETNTNESLSIDDEIQKSNNLALSDKLSETIATQILGLNVSATTPTTEEDQNKSGEIFGDITNKPDNSKHQMLTLTPIIQLTPLERCEKNPPLNSYSSRGRLRKPSTKYWRENLLDRDKKTPSSVKSPRKLKSRSLPLMIEKNSVTTNNTPPNLVRRSCRSTKSIIYNENLKKKMNSTESKLKKLSGANDIKTVNSNNKWDDLKLYKKCFVKLDRMKYKEDNFVGTSNFHVEDIKKTTSENCSINNNSSSSKRATKRKNQQDDKQETNETPKRRVTKSSKNLHKEIPMRTIETRMKTRRGKGRTDFTKNPLKLTQMIRLKQQKNNKKESPANFQFRSSLLNKSANNRRKLYSLKNWLNCDEAINNLTQDTINETRFSLKLKNPMKFEIEEFSEISGFF